MLKRFISYYRPHRRLFILDMLASLAVSLVGILYPIITRLMLNDLIPESVTAQSFSAERDCCSCTSSGCC
mgnify:CR=1 FL=1